MTLQERIQQTIQFSERGYFPEAVPKHNNWVNVMGKIYEFHTDLSAKAIEQDLMELIGEDEEYDDFGGVAINRDAYEPIIRNELKAELRQKLQDYLGNLGRE